MLSYRAQREVQQLERWVNDYLRGLAWKEITYTNCGDTNGFTACGSRGVRADIFTRNMTVNVLSIYGATVYWKAECKVGPRKCCATVRGCKGNLGSRASYSCKVSYTLYDKFDFRWWNPLGWLGVPFNLYGFWSGNTGGSVSNCFACKALVRPVPRFRGHEGSW